MANFIICIILELLSIAFLSLKVFVYNNYDTSITLFIVIILSILINLFISVRGSKNRNKDIYLWIVLSTLFVQILVYVLSIKTGFNNNINFIGNNYYLKFLEVVIIIYLTEKVRRKALSIDIRGNKRLFILYAVTVIFTVLVDLNISITVLPVIRYKTLFRYLAITVCSSISKNILLCYISKKYGYKPNLVYRFIMDLSVYILPVIDTTNECIRCVIMFIFPFVLYLIMDEYLGKNEKEESVREIKKSTRRKIFDTCVGVFLAIIVVLVSRATVYCMIGVGSGSMTGTINKGDALVYKKYDRDYTKYENKRLKEGDIIVFKRSNVLILHRINKVISSNGIDKYITKGDYNDNVDNWVVKQEDIEGVALFRVPFIAWPSVYLSELFV